VDSIAVVTVSVRLQEIERYDKNNVTKRFEFMEDIA